MANNHPSSLVVLTTILFISPLILAAMATSSFSTSPCPCTSENEIDLRLYLKQVIRGPDTNQFEISRPATGNFGWTVVNDWILVDAPVQNAKVIARPQGVHIMTDLASVGWFVSINIVFQADSK